jgi:hypothetical protein
MKRQLIIAIGIVLLTAGICSADNYVGGIPLTTVKEGAVSGGVYVDSYYGAGNQVNYNPITIDKTFTLPGYTDVEWAMLLTTVYCGHMQNNYEGTANISFNGNAIGDETLNVPFTFKQDGGSGYVSVNDHVNRVSSDYMMWYDVTNLIQPGVNTASVHTEQINDKFDGRIKLITLIVAYNDSSSSTKTYYWTNQGHDVDSYYSDDSLSEDYIGSTSFAASLPAEETLQNAELTAVHMASNDGSYTFNNNDIASGTPQGSYCGSNTWDITSSFDPSGTNTMTYNRSAGFYKIALGILTAQCQGQVSTQEADLQVLDMSVKHNNYNGAWAHLSNSVNVTVANNGAGNAGSFNVTLYANDSHADTHPVSGLAAGATTVVACNWIPEEVKTYTLKAVADSGDAINESNETNNELTKSQVVGNNGYKADKPLTTYKHESITGDMIYTHGNSTYSSEIPSGDAYTVNHNINLPEGASVKFARLYNYWTWSYSGTTGKYPTMNLTVNGNPLSPEDQYDDRKGWGMYDYPTGTWAYNVTDLVTGSGDYTTVITNTDTDANSKFCIDGVGLLVVFENPNGQTIEYWINEGADMINTQSTSGGLTPKEATVTSLFTGSVDLNNVDSARLWTVVQSGGNDNNMLLFNDMNWTNVYDGTPYADLDIDEARDVKAHLIANDNTARIRAAPDPGDYLTPSNAFLVITYSGTQVPSLSLSASPTTVTVGVPTDVTFTVTSNNTPVEGADVNLTGSANESGTTDANGTAVISVNATSEGTITATATKQSYNSATTAVTAAAKVEEGVSSSVSLSVKIIPIVALNVTPDSINFGELSAGETSGVHTLTIQNKGGYDINVTAGVAATSDNLFKDGLLLDSALYGSYHKTITALASDTADTTLKVPEDYVGVGPKEGALIIWAQQA